DPKIHYPKFNELLVQNTEDTTEAGYATSVVSLFSGKLRCRRLYALSQPLLSPFIPSPSA
ncbi:MAG TPA: hypothetical protein PK971_09390, partial [Saprospiraceae bacterium]|nr:hypothetical protein [Saprospiraceae bacterium]HNG89820.1 hypothetical protein [Saprospiraceae bacterium]